MNRHVYLWARVLSLAIVSWACSTGMALAAVGWSLKILPFSVGVFFITVLFSLVGVLLVTYTDNFLNYILLSVPAMVLLSSPLWLYFGLIQGAGWHWMPTQGPADLMIGGYEESLDNHRWWSFGNGVFWVLAFYAVAHWHFFKKAQA